MNGRPTILQGVGQHKQDNDELSWKMTRKNNTETSAADEIALKESLARLQAEISHVTFALALIRRMPPPEKGVVDCEAFGRLKKEGYVTKK